MNRIYQMIMKYLLPILFAFCFFSCHRHSDNWEKICDIEKYIESRPDSALAVLEAIDVENLSSNEERAKYALYMSMALDKNYIDKTDFYVLQPAIDYYEKHGSATDKLRTFYYQGRIFYNKGETEETMECLVKSIHLGKDSEDILVKARNYYLQSTLYIQYYNWEKAIESSLAGAEYYKALEKYDNYVRMLCRAAEGYIFLRDDKLAEKLLYECAKYLNEVNNRSKAYYYAIRLTHNCEESSEKDVYDAISEYLGFASSDNIDWIAVSHAYLAIGDISSSKNALSNYVKGQQNDARYYALLTKIYRAEGSYKDALMAYEQFNSLTDSLDFVVLKQDTQFVEERHLLELAKVKEEERRKQVVSTFIIVVAILINIALWISRRLRITKMEKIIIQKEAETYKLKYSEIEEERDNLNALLAQNDELSPEALNAVAKRLELLNKFFTAYITDNSDIDRKASKEMEDLLNDKDNFMNSTRLAYAGSHPKFIKYLEEKGLTEWEINYCCLYALGLKGKEVGAYIKMRSHYNNSSEVREKLGITEHDTNLGIYIRKLVKSLSE